MRRLLRTFEYINVEMNDLGLEEEQVGSGMRNHFDDNIKMYLNVDVIEFMRLFTKVILFIRWRGFKLNVNKTYKTQ